MTFPTTTINAMLNGPTIDGVSFHTGFPGTAGANEVTGGTPAYVRQSCVVNAASGGQRLLSATVTAAVPACTIRYVGFWSGTTFLGCAANGGATPKNFMAVPSTDVVYATGHGWSDTQKIVFLGVPPTGLTEGTTYFVRDSTADTFKVAATSGGTAIDITAASSFGCVVSAIVEQVYATQDTHALTAATFTIPV